MSEAINLVAADGEQAQAVFDGQALTVQFIRPDGGLAPNPLTQEGLINGQSADYVDLVHFRPPAGLWLLRQMGVRGL